MSRNKKKMGDRVENEEGKGQVEWPQFPYTAEELAQAVLTPIKSKERKKRLGISDDE